MAAHDWHRHAQQVVDQVDGHAGDATDAQIHQLRPQVTLPHGDHSEADLEHRLGGLLLAEEAVETATDLAVDLAALTRALLGLDGTSARRPAERPVEAFEADVVPAPLFDLTPDPSPAAPVAESFEAYETFEARGKAEPAQPSQPVEHHAPAAAWDAAAEPAPAPAWDAAPEPAPAAPWDAAPTAPWDSGQSLTDEPGLTRRPAPLPTSLLQDLSFLDD